MWSLFTTMCVCVYLLLEYLALANEVIPELISNDSSLFSAIHNSLEIKNCFNNDRTTNSQWENVSKDRDNR